MPASDDVSVHALTMPVEFGGRELSITPTAIETDRGLLLVDVGPQGAADRLQSELARLGWSLDDVQFVVCTHHDADHVGGLAELAEHTEIHTFAHVDEAPYVRGDRAPQKGDGGDRYPPAVVDVELVDGVRFTTEAGPVVIVSTPGHTPGHVSLFVPDERLLVAGDALVADGEQPLAGPKPAFTAEIETALDSVTRLADLDVDRTICFHGGYVPFGADQIGEIVSSADDHDH